MLSIPLVIRALAVLAINWFIKDIGTPPPEADGANQMGAQEGDKPAPEGKPNSIIKSLFSLIPTFATLYYGANYWNENPISIYDIGVFAIAFSGYSLRQWACHALGKFHTFVLGVKKDHILIETGPYRWLVHPSRYGPISVLSRNTALPSVPVVSDFGNDGIHNSFDSQENSNRRASFL